MCTRSEAINELAAALSKAQGMITPPSKSETAGKGAYQYTYADLAGVWEAIRKPLAESGLSVTQLPTVEVTDSLTVVHCESILMHTSGQWISNIFSLPVDAPGPQPIGKATTYARRYSLMALTGVAPEDDDCAENQQAAQQRPRQAQPRNNKRQAVKQPAKEPKGESKPQGEPDEEYIKLFTGTMQECTTLEGVVREGKKMQDQYMQKEITEATYLACRSAGKARTEQLKSGEGEDAKA